jgi:L-cysteate sulfo-lyase
VQSNSQRQVAAAAARLGFDCHLAVYHGRLAPPSPDYGKTGNALLNRLFGATLHDVPWNGDRNGAIRDLAEKLRARGRRPYVVPYRSPARWVPSPTPRRWRRSRPKPPPLASRRRPSFIVRVALRPRPAGRGRARLSARHEVVGIDIDAEPERSARRRVALRPRAADLLEQPFIPEDVEVAAGLAGPAYGVPHAATIEAIRLGPASKRWSSIPSIPARGLAGLISLIRAGRWTEEQNIVFVHTGGAPALFAYHHLFD